MFKTPQNILLYIIINIISLPLYPLVWWHQCFREGEPCGMIVMLLIFLGTYAAWRHSGARIVFGD